MKRLFIALAITVLFMLSSCTADPVIPTYTVTYNANGSTSGVLPVDTTNYIEGQTVTVLDNTGTLTKSGSSFSSWNTQENGNGSTYTQGLTFAMGNANVTLYVKWTDLLQIKINAAGDSFMMGDADDGPAPNVSQSISYDFQMSKFEITNAQFAQFIAEGGYSTQSYWTTNGWTEKTARSWTQPSSWTDANFNGVNQPVVGVSWYEAAAFCNWRSVKEGLTPAYDNSGRANLTANGYRLPTEVEWEYAAAKGAIGLTERFWAYGNTWDANKVVFNAAKTASVGSKSPDGDTNQGLADMSSNAIEWCNDNWQANIDIVTGTDRYFFVADTSGHVMRGGAWNFFFEDSICCASRDNWNSIERDNYMGFRLARY